MAPIRDLVLPILYAMLCVMLQGCDHDKPKALELHQNMHQNVVSVHATYATFLRMMPWQLQPVTFQKGHEKQSQATASGLVVKRGLILTASYIATDSVLINVRRQGRSVDYPAEIIAIAQDLGLALLNVTDPTFWGDGYVSIPMNDLKLPALSSKVGVMGFPLGGTQTASKLNARVSRIRASSGGSGRYSNLPHTVFELYPSVLEDISVGPVFTDDDDVAEATVDPSFLGFMSWSGAVVPVRTVSRFINSVGEFGKWSGPPVLGVLFQRTESPALREYWGLPMDAIGMQVTSLDPKSHFAQKVVRGDVLREVDGVPVQAGGLIRCHLCEDEDLFLPWKAVLGDKMLHGSTELTFWRRGKKGGKADTFKTLFKQSDDAGMEPLIKRVTDQQNQESPTYIIIGGLVWGVLSEELLQQHPHASMGVQLPDSTIIDATQRWREDKQEQIIVLLQTLEHKCNQFYNQGAIRVLKMFNDEPVTNMNNFITKVGEAYKSEGEYLRFVFKPLFNEDVAGGAGDPDIVLDRKTCQGSDEELLQRHGIQSQVSLDLATTFIKEFPENYGSSSRSFIGYYLKAAQMKKEPHSSFLVTRSDQRSLAVQPSQLGAEGILTAHENSRVSMESSSFVLLEQDNPTTWRTEVHPASGLSQSILEEKVVSMHLNTHLSNKEDDTRQSNLPWRNIVRIELVAAYQNFLQPWKKSSESRSRCSGIIQKVSEKRIMTNAHCVDSMFALYISREDHPRPVPAMVVELAHDVDLAWITTVDGNDEFWNAALGEVSLSEGLPALSEDVRVVGYPMGGLSITITKGIVSRIDGQLYPNGLVDGARNTPSELPIVQVDAAINHGNSGGPVFDKEGHLLGIAFAGMDGAQNIGYVIPNQLVANFIDSVNSHKSWTAQPELGVVYHLIRNPGMLNYVGLGSEKTGVQVRSVAPLSPLGKQLSKGDIILQVDGNNIDRSGTIQRNIHGNTVSLPLGVAISEKSKTTKTKLTIMQRQTHEPQKLIEQTLDVEFGSVKPLVRRFDDSPFKRIGEASFFAAQPTYFVFFGLIWGVASNPTFYEAYSSGKVIPWSVKKESLGRWRENEDEQVIMLLGGLESNCNMYVDKTTLRILKKVNNVEVKNMKQLVEISYNGLRTKEQFFRYSFVPLAGEEQPSDDHPHVVLSTKMCAAGDRALLEQNNVPWPPVSEDMRDVAEQKLNELTKAAQ